MLSSLGTYESQAISDIDVCRSRTRERGLKEQLLHTEREDDPFKNRTKCILAVLQGQAIRDHTRRMTREIIDCGERLREGFDIRELGALDIRGLLACLLCSH